MWKQLLIINKMLKVTKTLMMILILMQYHVIVKCTSILTIQLPPCITKIIILAIICYRTLFCSCKTQPSNIWSLVHCSSSFVGDTYTFLQCNVLWFRTDLYSFQVFVLGMAMRHFQLAIPNLFHQWWPLFVNCSLLLSF